MKKVKSILSIDLKMPDRQNAYFHTALTLIGGKLDDLGIRHCYLSKSNIQKQQVSGFYTNFACVYFVSNNNRLLGSRAR